MEIVLSIQPNNSSVIPLAECLHPQLLDDVIGQQHLLGTGKPLRVAFESGQPHSMILWGPPGLGKTTLARLMAESFNAEFIALSAVLSGVKDIRDSVEREQLSRAVSDCRTILFVDEVHRFKKAVNLHINQRFTEVIVQLIGLPHGSRGGSHV